MLSFSGDLAHIWHLDDDTAADPAKLAPRSGLQLDDGGCNVSCCTFHEGKMALLLSLASDKSHHWLTAWHIEDRTIGQQTGQHTYGSQLARRVHVDNSEVEAACIGKHSAHMACTSELYCWYYSMATAMKVDDAEWRTILQD